MDLKELVVLAVVGETGGLLQLLCEDIAANGLCRWLWGLVIGGGGRGARRGRLLLLWLAWSWSLGRGWRCRSGSGLRWRSGRGGSWFGGWRLLLSGRWCGLRGGSGLGLWLGLWFGAMLLWRRLVVGSGVGSWFCRRWLSWRRGLGWSLRALLWDWLVCRIASRLVVAVWAGLDWLWLGHFLRSWWTRRRLHSLRVLLLIEHLLHLMVICDVGNLVDDLLAELDLGDLLVFIIDQPD